MGKALMVSCEGQTLATNEELNLVGQSNGTTEATHQYSITEAATFTNLKARIASGGSGTNNFRMRKASANGNLLATRAGTGECIDAVNSDAFTAGQAQNIAYTDTGTDSVVDYVAANVEFASGHGCFHGASNTATVICDLASTTSYQPISGLLEADGTTTIANAQWKVRGYTTLEAFQVRIAANARLNNSVFSVNVNGVDVGTAITFATTATGLQTVTGMGISLSAGDLVCISMTLGAGVEDLTVAFVGVTMKSTSNQSEVISCRPLAANARTASATPNYYLPGGSNALETTEAGEQISLGFGARITNLRCYLSANTYTGSSTFILRVNGVARITLTIGAAGGAAWYENTSDAVEVGPADLLSIEWAGGTANSATLHAYGFTVAPSRQAPRSMNQSRLRRAA
jgi:hypothetical protein